MYYHLKHQLLSWSLVVLLVLTGCPRDVLNLKKHLRRRQEWVAELKRGRGKVLQDMERYVTDDSLIDLNWFLLRGYVIKYLGWHTLA